MVQLKQMVGNFSVNVPHLFGIEASKYMLCVKVAKCHWGNKWLFW